MKQTAVEWLVEQLEQHHTSIDIKNTVVFQQAKAMEKEQIMDAYREGRTDQQTRVQKYYNRSSAIYYTSTFNS
jgi:hypothetical protein